MFIQEKRLMREKEKIIIEGLMFIEPDMINLLNQFIILIDELKKIDEYTRTDPTWIKNPKMIFYKKIFEKSQEFALVYNESKKQFEKDLDKFIEKYKLT